MKKIALLLLVICSSAFSFQNTVIFDMDGVLVYQALSDQMWHIGLSNFIGGFNPFRIQSTYFDALDQVVPYRPDTPRVMYKGRQIPQIMADWLMGTPTSIIRQQINQKLDEIARRTDSKSKIKLVRSIANFTFTPERFVKAVKLLDEGARTIEKCYARQTDSGQRVNQIVILTNWDAESFNLLYLNKSIRKILQLADVIVVSGQVHMIKPDKRIYEYTFKQAGISDKNHKVVFIDDQAENLSGFERFAVENGFTNYHMFQSTQDNLRQIRKHLRRLRIY